ncbi:cell division protein FtsA [Sphingosinicella microcystinivorans]|uniref:Cell division protein FtsA n=1 Tax=Sphingosinicella microcystinivorans TaxID=335406 RepID=A0AAD1D8R2_SPHMI|nr:cell division protein FtsA [Sphingosinicella microcystinivorans]RKS88060.1 cell division protein FtsA [Sphingosinicella microcystinivorans]BBE35871.1 cell division protein FtsA [Sphingosinicella microcystinivorans]
MRVGRGNGSRGERTIAALDIGSSKVAALIAVSDGESPPRVIGTGQRACTGLRQGLVADLERTESAIRAAMEQAERNAGVTVENVVVSVSAGGLDSEIVSVEVDIGGQRIERGDIDHVLSEGRAQLDAGGRTILHAQPALYTLDETTRVMNPLGLHADRLGVDIHIITADTPPVRNLDQCVRTADLGVQTIVASPIAAGLACLAPEERELGVALVEIGAGVTNVAVHVRGMLVGLSVIPMGSEDITADIASTFSTRRIHAERLKTLYGSATTSPRDNHDMIEILPISEDDDVEPTRVPRAQIVAVIRDRLDMLFSDVGERLNEMGFKGPRGRQMVLTGGGAELKCIADFAQGLLGRHCRVGRPRGLVGLPEAQTGSAFSTLAGLALYGAEDREDLWAGSVRDGGQMRMSRSPWGRMIEVLRSSL